MMKYKLAPYIKIAKITNTKAINKYNISSPYIIIDNKNKSTYIINKSIVNLLLCFKTTVGYLELKKKLNLINPKSKYLVDKFIRTMIKRRILIKNKVYPNNKESEKLFDGKKNIPIYIYKKNSKEVKYEVKKKLKVNNKTAIYLALNQKREKVVLKRLILDKKLSDKVRTKKIEKFKQEFKILDLFKNYNSICQLYSFDNNLNMAELEFIEGKTLSKVIQYEKLSLENKLRIANKIVDILSYVHKKNVVHGDIHASQFIVDSNLNVKLLDFGFSNKLDNIDNEYRRRGGVYLYMEPENITPDAFKFVTNYKPSFQTDVYRLGVLIYYLFYEEFPFKNISWKELSKQIKSSSLSLEQKTANNIYIPNNVRFLIRLCMSKDKFLRPKSVCEVKDFI